MGRFVAVAALCAAALGSSCMHPAHGGDSAVGSNVISRDDIDRAHAATALDAVQRYRSDILVKRAPSSVYLNKQSYPVVFLDSQFWGQVDELKNISADGIKEIRLFSGTDAVRFFGAQYGGGVIQIVSRNGE